MTRPLNPTPLRRTLSLLALPLALLAGCATTPSGPSVTVLPGSSRSFEEFRADDFACRAYAFQEIGGEARAKSANETAVGHAALGAAVGALAGAAMGGRDGAGIGAGMGLIIGSTSGAETSQRAAYGGQRQYDAAYVQCMYAKGHRVPISGHYTPAASPSPAASVPPPSPAVVSPPPPPAGSPPPPPPAR
ncbi:MAG: hypothetical protein N2690_06605 [Rhodocyclaceae bacterium]|nr:hypothetical protein [Rhodocyclaceae bacterium]